MNRMGANRRAPVQESKKSSDLAPKFRKSNTMAMAPDFKKAGLLSVPDIDEEEDTGLLPLS